MEYLKELQQAVDNGHFVSISNQELLKLVLLLKEEVYICQLKIDKLERLANTK